MARSILGFIVQGIAQPDLLYWISTKLYVVKELGLAHGQFYDDPYESASTFYATKGQIKAEFGQ
jgi:hypothetical protein